MILMIDNYDSFTYNLVQYLGELGEKLVVVRNDKASVEELLRMRPARVVISPGPCTPDEAGVSVEAVRAFAGRVPVFGVCLGHQSIGQAFGGKIVRAGKIMHGKTSMIHHDKKGVFKGLPNPFEATRYHSLIIEKKSIPGDLQVTAWTKKGEIMGVRHKKYDVEGVQFHPESILTKDGMGLLANFVKKRGRTDGKKK